MTTLTPITAVIPDFTVIPVINTTTFPEDIDQYNTEMPTVITAQQDTTDQINNLIPQLNELETNVNAMEASTVEASEAAVAAANYEGDWINQGYTKGHSVSYSGSTYACKLTHVTGFVPTNTTYWQPIGLVAIINNATAKTTPVDADELALTDSETSFSLKKLTWANLKANIPTGKNYIINGGFDYWNYATSQTTSGYGSDDRWDNTSVGSTKVHSQVLSGYTERALFNSSKFSRTVVTSVAGVDNAVLKKQRIENVTKLAGKTITISFKGKVNTPKNIAIELQQYFGTGGTPSSAVHSIGSQLIPLTTTWSTKSVTIVLPSIIGKILGTDGVHTSYTVLNIWFDSGSNFSTNSASLGQQSGTFDIAEVKLEEGSVATPWTPYEGEFGGEVQACQRYLPTAQGFYSGYAATTSEVYLSLPMNVIPRVPPSGISYTLSGSVYYSSTSSAITNIVWFATGVQSNTVKVNPTGTPLTIGNGVMASVPKILFTGCEL